MTKKLIITAALALIANACASSDLVTKTAADAGYTSVEEISTSLTNLGEKGCREDDAVAHVRKGMRNKRLVTFTVCCGASRVNGCETVERI
jgi:uncharacterized lipoprotein YajG